MKKAIVLLSFVSSLALAACSDFAPKTYETQLGDGLSAQAADILSKMTLEEKVGQVIQADISAVTPEEARQYNLGSVLNGGNSAPGGGKIAPAEDWIALADAFWIASSDTSDGGVGIPLLWGTDAVHGHNNLQSATIFPHNSALGATQNPSLMRDIGDVTAREIRATGLDWTFAPTLAVARDDRWGRAYESYSERPEIVAQYAKAMVEGLQGKMGADDFLIGDNVMATAKHFIGDGGTQLGIDKGDAIGDPAELIAIHGAGYGPAFDAGVQSVMSSFSSINGEKMHGSKELLTDVLRGDMGFEGFVVGDWNGHGEIPGCTVTDCPDALLAGIDMYMAPESWRGLYESLLAQAKAGEVPMARLDEAVMRILKVKIRSGLLSAGLPSARASADPKLLGAQAHRDVARRAVRESLVLLKNTGQLLPLRGSPTVLVTGSGANSMQQQTGGWTLNWQGDNNPNEIFETGETVFSGLSKALSAQGGKAILSENGEYENAPDVAVVVFGEQPYAEFFGDVSDVVFEYSNKESLTQLRSLKAKGIPVVSVFLTGRPLWVNPHINASDAFVVGWLPGTEGGGIADVLVADENGKARHDTTGRLSFTWPMDGTGTPLNGETKDGVLFPYGYGLSYGDEGSLAPLSEDSKVADSGGAFTGNIVTRGNAGKALSLWLGDSTNSNTPADSVISASLGGLVTTRGVDYQAQEDSREITWHGPGHLTLKSPRPIDLSAEADQALTLRLRVDAAPTAPFTIGTGCGGWCEGSADISESLARLPAGEWTEVQLPLSCLIDAGLNAGAVSAPVKFTASGPGKISLHSVTLSALSGAERLPCPAE